MEDKDAVESQGSPCHHDDTIIIGSSHGVVANMVGCDIVVSEFDLQSHHYVHFRANTLGKGMNPLSPQL